MDYRNTPRFDGLSPSQWLFGRRQRTEAAALPNAYNRISDSDLATHEVRRKEEMDKRKNSVDQSSKSLSPLPVGTEVYVQNPISKRWDSSAVITHQRNDRSYTIKNDLGKYYLRNRKFLRPKTACSVPAPSLSNSIQPGPSILKPRKTRSNSGPIRRSPRLHSIRFADN